MGDCKPSSTLCKMDMNKIINNKDKLIGNKLYPEIIGSLIYIMIAMRLDIWFTVTRLFQDLVKLPTTHLTRAKHILSYLKGTINQSLALKKITEAHKTTKILQCRLG